MKQFIFQLQYSLVCDCTDGVLRTQALVRRQERSSVVNQIIKRYLVSGHVRKMILILHYTFTVCYV